MEPWEDPQLRRVLDALHRLYAAQDTATFPDVMMSVADEIVPCANLSFDIINTATGAARNGFHRPPPMPHAEFMERWSHLHVDHPGIQYIKAGGFAPVIALSDFTTRREFENTGLHQDLFRELGIRYQLGVVLPVAGHVVGMAMNREVDFTPAERELVQQLHPHFLQAFQRTQLFASLQGIAPLDYLPWRRHGLTRRECDVLRWLMEGKKNREIATILGIFPRTVDTHVVHIFAKLGVQTRIVAANRARDLLLGLSRPADAEAVLQRASLAKAGEPGG